MKPKRNNFWNKVKLKYISFFSVGIILISIFTILLTRASGPSINATGSSSMLPLMSEYSNFYEKSSLNVSSGGSGHGISQISEGNTDIGNMSSDEQSSIVGSTYEKGWKKNKIKTVTVAIDAIGIVVNLPDGMKTINNKKPVINIEELALIYDNKPDDRPTWKQLIMNYDSTSSSSSLDTKVQGYGRDGGKGASGTSEGFFHTLTKYANYKKGTKADENHILDKIKKTQEANSAAFKILNSANQGVTYISLGYAIQASKDPISNVKIAEINVFKVDPTIENASNGSYKWVRPFNSAFSVNSPQNVIDFIIWMLNVASSNENDPKYGEAFKLFTFANCVPLSKKEAQIQINNIKKSDFDLLSSSNENLKNTSFGLNLDYWAGHK